MLYIYLVITLNLILNLLVSLCIFLFLSNAIKRMKSSDNASGPRRKPYPIKK